MEIPGGRFVKPVMPRFPRKSPTTSSIPPMQARHSKRRITKMEKPVVKLIGQDGNAFAILGACARVARKNKMDWEAIQKEMTSGDYNHLLATADKYFEIE
jgi:hypothetical protein